MSDNLPGCSLGCDCTNDEPEHLAAYAHGNKVVRRQTYAGAFVSREGCYRADEGGIYGKVGRAIAALQDADDTIARLESEAALVTQDRDTLAKEVERLRDTHVVMQDDIAAVLRALGLSNHARDASPHEVMMDEVVPAIVALRSSCRAVAGNIASPRIVIEVERLREAHDRMREAHNNVLELIESRLSTITKLLPNGGESPTIFAAIDEIEEYINDGHQCPGYAGDPGASAPRCESYRGHPGACFIRRYRV